AWGLFNKDGRRDQVGTLNFLRPETILRAKDEIVRGEAVCLNYQLQHAQLPAVARSPLRHTIKSLSNLGYYAYDDEITINSQSGSQWDGLSTAHQETRLHYNNLAHESIQDPACNDNSIHYWSLKGGIVGCGVLIDYHSWALKQGIKHPAVERTCISVIDIEKIAASQGVELLTADILIILTGWTEWYNQSSDAERNAGTTGDKHIGLEGTEETVRWLWNNHFAAVASAALALK
ncbi:uncharacterized protein A1O9_09397, partial [Exophiala aquamarina CBS 119918]